MHLMLASRIVLERSSKHRSESLSPALLQRLEGAAALVIQLARCSIRYVQGALFGNGLANVYLHKNNFVSLAGAFVKTSLMEQLVGPQEQTFQKHHLQKPHASSHEASVAERTASPGIRPSPTVVEPDTTLECSA